MWAVRILSGPQAGQIFELKMGRNLVGRAAQCDVKITSGGVSKEHSEIHVYKDKILAADLKSSNGTYLNGIKIQSSVIRLGDKLSIHDVIMDIIPASEGQRHLVRQSGNMMVTQGLPQDPNHGHHGGAQNGAPAPGPAPAYVAQGPVRQAIDKLQTYLDRVALPGIYRLPQLVEFKFVLLGFVVIFIFSTTLLSMIPMLALTRASVMSEAKRRAQSIARTVATLNQKALLADSYTNLNTNSADSEEGVKQVLIVQQSDGMILAPASRAGTTPDLPFVHTARREMRPITIEVDSSTIGASFPIGLYDPNTGEQTVKAHAIVLYDSGSLAYDDGHALSLFMQTLVLACLIGMIIYYFMYKLIEYPILSLNKQLDTAMRDKTDSTDVKFQFPALQALIGNINSLLNRYVHGDGTGGIGGAGFSNKDGEAENLVLLIGYPCGAIGKEGQIIAVNLAFSQLLRMETAALQGQNIRILPDLALQKNLEGLMIKAKENMRAIHTDQLEFSGHPCVLSCQAMGGAEVDYYLVTVAPAEGGAG
jgi:hypothetical protein